MCFSQDVIFGIKLHIAFIETPVTLQAYFFQKMPELSWQALFGTLT